MESTKLGKYTITFSNSTEYHTLKREIWGQDCYHFNTENPTPYIVDVGAHIGISVLYFKHIYPECEIVAFEPQRESFEILEENILNNGITDVTLVNKAVHNEEGIKTLYIDGTDNGWFSNASFLENSWSGKESTTKVTVETTTLEKYLNKSVDCLKIDTEGSELTILKSIKRFLPNIHNIFVEYHPVKGSNPDAVVDILRSHFDIEIYSEGKPQKRVPSGKLLTIKGKKSVK